MLFSAAADLIFSFQDVKNSSSTKEALDDLFPSEDEEQSQSKTLLNLPFTDFNEKRISSHLLQSRNTSKWRAK